MHSQSPLILLYSGWQTANIGDVGHTPGTLRYLEQHLPDARVALWLATTTPAITAMLRRRFPEVQIVQGNLDGAGRASTPELQAAFDACVLFIQNSGMHFNRFWGSPMHVLDAPRATGKAVCLYGQSFDGFAPENEAAMAARLSEAALIYTRETTSRDYLRRIGVCPRRAAVEFGPDGCFGIDVRDDARAGAFLARHGLEPRRFITVTLRSNTPKVNATAGDVLNPIVPSAEEQAQDERWAASLRALIHDWVGRTGGKVLLAPEMNKEIAAARRLLWEPLPAAIREKVVHRETFWDVDEAASVYARAHTVVSMEPHSCIIALANGTPALHVFSRKHGVKAGMFADLGAPQWLIDIDGTPAATATAALNAINADYPAALAKARRVKDDVDQRSAEMVGEIGSVLAAHAREGGLHRPASSLPVG